MASVVKPRFSYEPQPMFDRRALPVYVMLGGAVALAGVLLTLGGYSIATSYLLVGWTLPILLIAAFLARRIGHPRIGGALEANILITGQGVFIYLLLIPLAAHGGPWVDPALSRADVALGFNWPAYANWAAPYMPVLLRAYRSFQWQPSLVIILLFYCRLEARAWRLVTAAGVALIVTALLFPFVPARGAFDYYGIHHYSGFASREPWQIPEVLGRIRSGSKLIDRSLVEGIVSFPSFHTVMAVLLTWAAWPTKARYPVLVLNILMVMAAIVCGSHYLVDLVGGAILATASLYAAKRLEVGRYDNLTVAARAAGSSGRSATR